jgi:hypothetical protein
MPMCDAELIAVCRTLQEGVLSGKLVFPLSGSLAYLKLLWPQFDDGLSLSFESLGHVGLAMLSPQLLLGGENDRNPRPESSWLRKLRCYLGTNEEAGQVTSAVREEEPLRDRIRNELFNFAKTSLNVEEYRDYARGPVSSSNAFGD